MSPLHPRRPDFILLAAVVMAILVYWPGLHGPFVFDDIPNIVENEKLHVSEINMGNLVQIWESGFSGPLKRPVAMFTLALNYRFSQFDTFSYKLTNLGIHILCAIGIYFLFQRIVTSAQSGASPHQARLISVLAASAWLLHPMQVSAQLLAVQRMTSLSALFAITTLWLYMSLRQRWNSLATSRKSTYIAAIVASSLMSVFSKENGILIPLYLVLIESYVSSPASQSHRDVLKWFWRIFFLIIALGLFLAWGNLESAYSNRSFTLIQRLLTEPRVLMGYLFAIIYPRHDAFSLYHDGIALSSSLISPPTTFIALAGLLAISALAYAFRNRLPIFSLAWFFYLLGHSIESSVIPLEIAHEHRNYLPSIFLYLAAAQGLMAALPNRLSAAKYAMLTIIMAVLSWQTFLRADMWKDPLSFAVGSVLQAPNSPRAHYNAANVMHTRYNDTGDPQAFSKAMEHYQKAQRLNPKETSFLISQLFLAAQAPTPNFANLLTDTLSAIKHHVMSGQTVNALISLTRCSANGHCALRSHDLDPLIAESTAKATLSKDARAQILAQYVALLNAENRLDDAEHQAELAVRLAPNEPQHKLNYAAILIKQGKLSEAKNVLKAFQQLELLPLYRHRLQRLESAIAEREFDPT